MNARCLVFLLFLPLPALAQGYAGLGGEAQGYAEVTRPANFAFPRDHGSHPGFRIEWWYLTANLDGADGNEYGIQWTLFRQAIAPGEDPGGWESNQVWLAHAGLTTAEDHFAAQTYARGGIGQAGVTPAPFRAWIDDWEMRGADGPGDAMSDLTVTATAGDFAYTLEATSTRPPVPQGENGYSVKSEAGQASYYYSQPFYEITGTLAIEGREIAVTGTGWLDREWSSQPLESDQEGWDWFSLSLADGARVMLFRVRDTGGGAHRSGTWIAPDGTATPLDGTGITMTPTATARVAGREIPVRWRLEIPAFDLAVDTAPLNAQSWMDLSFAYWEGPVSLSGSHEGRGYLEMTGYPQ